LQDVLAFAVEQGFRVTGLMASPLRGPKGNVEFLARLTAGMEMASPPDLEPLIEAALRATR
jgi:23S rRNA (cytidine1920-2'-O)/16S rRNA (cytidine1409-2'-O)-methyltransferase